MRFTIRDLLWLTVVAAIALLLVIEQRAHRKNIEILNARNDQTIRQRDGLRWQLIHAADAFGGRGLRHGNHSRHHRSCAACLTYASVVF
jgi:hypothetical protein